MLGDDDGDGRILRPNLAYLELVFWQTQDEFVSRHAFDPAVDEGGVSCTYFHFSTPGTGMDTMLSSETSLESQSS
ncbi:hypothetical protein D3C87_1661620 [compost metagenome]